MTPWNKGPTGFINQIGQKDGMQPSPQGQRKQLLSLSYSKFPEYTAEGREGVLCPQPKLKPLHRITLWVKWAPTTAEHTFHTLKELKSKAPPPQVLPLLRLYRHGSCHCWWRGQMVTGRVAPHTGSSCAQPGWEAPGMWGTVPPPLTHSSPRGKGRSGADPRRSGKTHPEVLRSATRKKGGRTQFLSAMIWYLHTYSKVNTPPCFKWSHWRAMCSDLLLCSKPPWSLVV